MLIWWWSRKGMYLVRLVYYGIMEDLIDNQHLRKPGNWMLIWRVKIPNKVKLMLWRVTRGCLPTRMNLRKRHVPCEDHCLMCREGTEDDMHLIFRCDEAQSMWERSRMLNIVCACSKRFNDFSKSFFCFL